MAASSNPPSSGATDELGDVLERFSAIQSELNYRHAHEVLKELVEGLDLTEDERSGLESEIGGLESTLNKLEHMIVRIAVFGMVGRGKSSVLNALLGHPVFETGAIHGVTQTVQAASWNWQSTPALGSDPDVFKVSLPSLGESQVELVDTPGIDEVDGEVREQLAQQIAQASDLILFIIAGDITKVEYDALLRLRQVSKPMLLVFNKVDQYPNADRQAIYQTLRDQRLQGLISPDEIVMTAAAPLVQQAVRQQSGIAIEVSRGTPHVEELQLKILDVLDREGKSLIALNSLLYADRVNERLVQRKMQIREQTANQTIWNGVMTKAVATALNPLTVVDIMSGAVIDIAMILTLSKLYGIAMTQQGGADLLKTIALGMGGVTLGELVAIFGLGSLKGLLGLSAPATGGASLAPYVSVAITQAAIAGVSSYAIGQVTKTYLANGASWGVVGPKATIQQILASLDETSLLNRIKDELHAKLKIKGI
ncbi:MAG: DUF697 domain-containing protein [Leptolyngbyaceae cyanobacterium SL_7_1]|nr:DUF697 domain-containing protein [Leptolyngbyaceae cyanobacterium SL_7_1]